MKSKLSIVTVSFNSEKTIERTIRSVLLQAIDNYEYLIIDGGSSDKTVEIIKKYEPLFLGKMKWISEPDDGIYDAMNKGISLSIGNFIGFINSDDWYEANALKTVLDNIENYPDVDMFFGVLNVWVGEELVKSYCNFPNNISKDSLAHPSVFLSRSTFEKIGGYSLSYRSASDYELFIRLFDYGIRYKYIGSSLANFQRGGISGTSLGYFETLSIKYKYNKISVYFYLYCFFRKKVIDYLRCFKQALKF